MAKLQKSDQQQLWAEAQRRCRLSNEGLRVAKESDLSPRSLIENALFDGLGYAAQVAPLGEYGSA